jgi:hypothetical protein
MRYIYIFLLHIQCDPIWVLLQVRTEARDTDVHQEEVNIEWPCVNASNSVIHPLTRCSE